MLGIETSLYYHLIDNTMKTNKGDSNSNNKFEGVTKELKGFVYVYGANKNQGAMYVKTTDEIAEYAGREIGFEMFDLIKELKECGPVEPAAPDEMLLKEGSNTYDPIAARKFDIKYKRYCEKTDEYEEHKGRLFRGIKGQCSLAMKNRVESHADYKTWEANKDVIALLKRIKEIAYGNLQVQNEYWAMVEASKSYLVLQQGRHEGLPNFYRRFKAQIDMTESKWGLLCPMKYKDLNDNERQEHRDKYLACVFLAGLHEKHDEAARELNNDYVKGIDKYPETVEEMMQMITNRIGKKEVTLTDDNQTGSMTSFAQRDMKCWKCKGYGHASEDCKKKKKKKDDDSDDGSDDDSVGSENKPQYWQKKKCWSNTNMVVLNRL